MTDVASKPDGRKARRAGTKDAILSAATRLFVTKGMSATSVDDIAEAAQVAKGSIYYNFTSKNHLVESLMTEYLQLTREALVAAAGELRGIQRQRAILSELLRVVASNPDAARLMVNEVFRTDRSWKDTAQAWRAVTMDLLAQGMPTPADTVSGDRASVSAAAMVGATLAAAMEWLAFRPHLSLNQVSEEVFATLGL